MLQKRFWIFILIVLAINVNSAFAIDEVTDLQGKIALIGTDYNIYTYDGASEALTQLSDNANTVGRYQWTTWSTDGRLAYFCCENNPVGQAFISSDGATSSQLLYENTGTVVIYAYWSPADCGVNCRELAMLVNSTDGLAIDILTDSANPSVTTIGTGSPYYYHWDSTGTQMIFHRRNRDLDIYNRAENDISDSLESSSGLFQVPVWSPIDDRILVGLPGSSQGLSDLAIIENGEARVLVADIAGGLSFLWSPDGRYIAYRSIDQFGYGGISVIDADSGAVISVADNTGAVAFFWSPDSTKIAYLTIETGDSTRNAKVAMQPPQDFVQDDSPTRLLWHVLDIEAESNLSYSSFIPSYEIVYLLTYFEQFAPSHRLWSPDSRYLVFPGAIANTQTEPSIYVLDTEDMQAELQVIADGVFGIWSFE